MMGLAAGYCASMIYHRGGLLASSHSNVVLSLLTVGEGQERVELRVGMVAMPLAWDHAGSKFDYVYLDINEYNREYQQREETLVQYSCNISEFHNIVNHAPGLL